MGEGGQKVQTSSYEINKSQGCNVQHGDYSQQHCTVYLKVAKRMGLKVFILRKENCHPMRC